MIMKTLVLLVVGCLALATSCRASSDLKALCNDEPLALTKISQVASLIEEAATSPPAECSRKLIDALNDLKPILTEAMHDVCSVDKAGQIVDFHKRHISKSSWSLKGASLPGSLERFVLAFGLKVGAVCRQSMLSSLVGESQKQLTGADFDTFKANGGSLLTAMSSKLKDLDDILLLSDIARPSSQQKVYIATAFSSRVKRIQVACESRFRPFYAPLVLPFAILSFAGYSITSTEPKRELVELKSSEALGNWYEIALLCETFAKLETFDSSESDARKIRMLKPAEAEELRKTQPAEVDQSSREVPDQVSFVPTTLRSIADLVLDETDASLLGKISEFRSRRKTLRRLRRKAVRRLTGVLKKALLSNHEVSFISSFFRSRKPDNNLDFLEAVEEEIKHEEESEKSLVRRRRETKAESWRKLFGYVLLDLLGVTAVVVCILLWAGVFHG